MPATLRLLLNDRQCAALDFPAGTIGYLEDYDLDAGVDGWLGSAKITLDPTLALRWPTKADALMAWREQSTKHPLRPDGRPNKPLSAYTAELIDIETEEEP